VGLICWCRCGRHSHIVLSGIGRLPTWLELLLSLKVVLVEMAGVDGSFGHGGKTILLDVMIEYAGKMVLLLAEMVGSAEVADVMGLAAGRFEQDGVRMLSAVESFLLVESGLFVESELLAQPFGRDSEMMI
jgi:hypothetical protein